MIDVLKRKTRRGWRYYVRGMLAMDGSGNLHRTSKLVLTDGAGNPICDRGQAYAEGERLEKEAEARGYRIRQGIPDPKPQEPTAKPLTISELADKFLTEYARPKIKDLAQYRRDAKCILKQHIRPAL